MMNPHPLKRLLLVGPILLAAVLAANVALGAGENQDLEPAPADKPAPKPRNPALVEVADVPGLPRVLLLGDSISMGYTLPVRKKLEGIANVHRPLENCGDTARGLVHLDAWLGKGHWDVIHFNFGLHDLKYLDARGKLASVEDGRQVAPPEVYARRLRELTLRLKATGATLIFATITPVPPGAEGRVAGDEVRYNQAALAVMRELGVGTDDLWSYVSGQQEKTPPATAETAAAPGKGQARQGGLQLPRNVHFMRGGYNQLATVVAASIRKALKPAP